MPVSQNSRISPRTGAGEPARTENAAGAPALDIERLATLVANGEVAWPSDLPEPQAAELTAKVRRRHRSRLITIIARLVAADIARHRPHGESHASQHI